jgi:hypothetical protein
MTEEFKMDAAMAAHFSMAVGLVETYEKTFRALLAKSREKKSGSAWLARFVRTKRGPEREAWDRFTEQTEEVAATVRAWREALRSGRSPDWPAPLVPWWVDGRAEDREGYDEIMPKIFRSILRPWITHRRLLSKKDGPLRSLWLSQLAPYELGLVNHLIANVTPHRHGERIYQN